MGSKVEVGWTTPGEDGVKHHVAARKFGGEWRFYERSRRKGKDVRWEEVEDAPIDYWRELLDALERRSTRDMISPQEVEKVRRRIRELFPNPPPKAPARRDGLDEHQP